MSLERNLGGHARERGLRELGPGLYAYLQPGGSWGWSNAGLISDGGHAVLVDTLFDLGLTGAMLQTMRDAVPAAARFDALVNTHGNGDHWFGNQLVPTSRIIATRQCAEEMLNHPPEAMAAMMAAAPGMGATGAFLRDIFGRFQFGGILPTLPTETFDSEFALRVGGLEVRLRDLGPAHTSSDSIVHVPEARTVFTGDLLFIGGHPVMWSGPSENWIAALDTILGLDVDHIVPGHGPLTDKEGVREVHRYWDHLRGEARQRYEAGMEPMDAARDISMDDFASWGNPERLIVNVISLYREFAGDSERPSREALFGQMAALAGYGA
jgi:glyoxylase-like metal-dependent hydrolase (beta-lactamase superfamily II)